MHNDRTIVCLCGSTRFMEAFQEANLRETLAGKIVLSVGCDTKSDSQLGLSEEVKAGLDALHLNKIDLADEILVLNVGGYVGRSTAREILYAYEHDKPIRWLEETVGDEYCCEHEPGGWTCGQCRAEAIIIRFFAPKGPRGICLEPDAQIVLPSGSILRGDIWQHGDGAKAIYAAPVINERTIYLALDPQESRGGQWHVASDDNGHVVYQGMGLVLDDHSGSQGFQKDGPAA